MGRSGRFGLMSQMPPKIARFVAPPLLKWEDQKVYCTILHLCLEHCNTLVVVCMDTSAPLTGATRIASIVILSCGLAREKFSLPKQKIIIYRNNCKMQFGWNNIYNYYFHRVDNVDSYKTQKEMFVQEFKDAFRYKTYQPRAGGGTTNTVHFTSSVISSWSVLMHISLLGSYC